VVNAKAIPQESGELEIENPEDGVIYETANG
jgi:hypothetical protein